MSTHAYLDIDQLQPGKFQPRITKTSFTPEALAELAATIRENGVVQDIVVRKLPGGAGRYEIIAGERRWRAAQIAGLTRVPCSIKEVSNQQAFVIALIENIDREDLTPYEESMACARMADEFELTHQEIADALGKQSRECISEAVRVLKLPEPILNLYRDNLITRGHARAMLAIENEGEQRRVAERIVREGLSVRQVEKLAKRGRAGGSARATPGDVDTRRLERLLADHLQTRVRLRLSGKNGGGRMELEFGDPEQLQGLLEKMQLDLDQL